MRDTPRWLRAFVTALLLTATAGPHVLGAQGVLKGRVLRDISRTPVAGAEVLIADSDQRATTDSSGAFSIEDLPPGWAIIQVRKVGYTVRRDTVNVRGSGITTRDFLLSSLTRLDTVKTVAAESKYVSPALRGFDERRKNATGGYFITEDVLRQADEKSLAGVIVQRTPGLHAIVQAGVGTTIASSRKSCSGPVFSQGKSCQPCYVTTYVDGQLVYEAAAVNAAPPIDFARMPVNDYAAVEFYPGSGTAPAQFGRTSSGCGVLLLWTRER